MLSRASFDWLIAILFLTKAVETLVARMQSVMKRLQPSHWMQIGLGCLLQEECSPVLLSLWQITDGGPMGLPPRAPCSVDLPLGSGAPHWGKGKVTGTGSPTQTWDLALLCKAFDSESGLLLALPHEQLGVLSSPLQASPAWSGYAAWKGSKTFISSFIQIKITFRSSSARS